MNSVDIVHGTDCFVCGSAHNVARPDGIQVRFCWHGDTQKVQCESGFGIACQGAPGYVHGGALFALLDEAMGAACWMSGHKVMSAHVGIDYRRPVQLTDRVQILAWIDRVDGRKVHTMGELRVHDVLVTQAKGLFVSSERHDWDLMKPARVEG